MKLAFYQRGLSPLGTLAVLLVAVFVGTFVLKVATVYLENMAVRDSVKSVVEQGKVSDMTPTELRGKLSKLFQVNMIDVINTKDIKISLKDGKTIIDARYERRTPLMFNIDVVVKFDTLLYEFTASPGK